MKAPYDISNWRNFYFQTFSVPLSKSKDLTSSYESLVAAVSSVISEITISQDCLLFNTENAFSLAKYQVMKRNLANKTWKNYSLFRRESVKFLNCTFLAFKKKAVSYYWRLILLELTRISNDNWNWSEFLSSGIFHRLRKAHATKFMHNFLQCEILSLLTPGQNPALTSFAKRYLIKTNVLILLCKDNFIERQVAPIVCGKKNPIYNMVCFDVFLPLVLKYS